MSFIKTLLDKWSNFAVDVYNRDSNAYDVLDALATAFDDLSTRLDTLRDTRFIDSASGDDLDKIGELGGINRRTGETDGEYRARIKSRLTAGNSGATFDDLVSFAAATLRIDPVDVRVDTDFSDDPVAVVTTIDFDELDTVNITADDFFDALEFIVPVSHTVTLDSSGTFEVESDSYSPPSGTGFISDSNDTGGKLSGTFK